MWVLLVAMGSLGAGLVSPIPAPSGAQCLGSACFALFVASSTFAEAGGVCEAGGGHLMTVRSTVADEAIRLLLPSNGPASAWLGLSLAEGRCVEPAERLRGFQWVTGDAGTDFEAWESGASGLLCGPTCVAVTRRHLGWQERACNASADAFLCEYSYPNGTCGPLAAGSAVGYLTPFGARDGDLAAFPPGTTAQVPGLDALLECLPRPAGGAWAWGSAAPGAWDCGVGNGGCEDHCELDQRGRPACACLGGKTLLEDQRSCWDPCATQGCQQHCEPHGATGICMCFEGYELGPDTKSCLDIDDCLSMPRPCEQECINTPGSFECRCWQGYNLVDGKCQPGKWACFDLTCEHECALVDGKYKCTCFEGYIPDPQTPHKCLRVCNQSECDAQCDPHTMDQCYCPENFVLDERPDGVKVCVDINECDSGYCGPLKCINTPGSYSCVCPDGQVQEGDADCQQPPSEEPDDFSGQTDVYPRSPLPPSVAPPKDGSSGRGTLVAIVVSVGFTVVMLVVLICYLGKKRYAAQSRPDCKSQQAESGVALQRVSLTCDSSGQKM